MGLLFHLSALFAAAALVVLSCAQAPQATRGLPPSDLDVEVPAATASASSYWYGRPQAGPTRGGGEAR